MSVKLSQDDFQRLVQILLTLSEFQTVTGRVRLVRGALEGSPRAQDILGYLDLDGPPRPVAIDVILRLSNFGRVTLDQEALGILINELLLYKGEADTSTAFLRSLFSRYNLDKPIAPSPALDLWHGTETDITIQEKIIGEDTLRPIAMLEKALWSAQAVVHISGPQGLGTGFMFGPKLLMTNHHVINSKINAETCVFTFGFELDINNNLKHITRVSAQPNGLFYTNITLDYSVVQLREVPEQTHVLPLRPVRVERDARVAIIQHPSGLHKKISMQNNFVVYADASIVQYPTSTLPGSSGSPVFDNDFQVVALHHAGGNLLEPSTQRRYKRNEGISMFALLQDLQINAPDIYSKLKS